MKEKLHTLLRRNAVILIAAALLLALLGGVTLAQFNYSHRAKRVIAAYDNTEKLFSSNYLQELDGSGRTRTRTYSYTEDEDHPAATITVPVTIRNFAGNHYVWYKEQNLAYSLTARVVQLQSNGTHQNVTDAPAVTIRWALQDSAATSDTEHSLAGSGASYTYSGQSLGSDSYHTDTYYVTFPVAAFLAKQDYYVLLEANAAPDDVDDLSVYLTIQKMTKDTSTGWEIVSRDDMTRDIANYSGFNYQVHGVGAGTVTLNWPSSLEINQLFLASIQSQIIDSSTTSLSFTVNSETRNGYDIQFYRKNGAAISQWSDIDSAVTCSFMRNDD